MIVTERMPRLGPRGTGHRDRAPRSTGTWGPRRWSKLRSRAAKAGWPKDGPLVVETGKHTGRSAQDKFIVRDAETEDTRLVGQDQQGDDARAFRRAQGRFPRRAGGQGRRCSSRICSAARSPNIASASASSTNSPGTTCSSARCWCGPRRTSCAGFAPEYTIIDLPSFRADPARHGCRSETVIAVNFTEKLILIGGTAYAGEMKKSVFGLLNYLLPPTGVMPMHCSANIGPNGDTAVFFGLSGTGKTTLSADASRTLIGDDEHGWSDTAVFNFEGGCYAKMIRLSAEAEPEIFATTKRFGTVLENVVMDRGDARARPRRQQPRREQPRRLSDRFHPQCLGREYGAGAAEHRHADRRCLWRAAADREADARSGDVSLPVGLYRARRRHRDRRDRARGDLLDLLRRAVHAAPPVGLRQSAQGADRQGRRRLLAGQHRLDRRQIRRRPAACRSRRRARCSTPRSTAASTTPNSAPIPISASRCRSRCRASIATILDPRQTWADKAAYDATAAKLVDLFVDNFAQFETHVDEGVRQAAPSVQLADG